MTVDIAYSPVLKNDPPGRLVPRFVAARAAHLLTRRGYLPQAVAEMVHLPLVVIEEAAKAPDGSVEVGRKALLDAYAEGGQWA